MIPRPVRERGFALLIVLWTLGMIALVATRLAAAGRSEAQLAGNLGAAAHAEATADAAIYQAVFHVLDDSWHADNVRHVLRVGDGTAEVRVENLAGRVNPNMASPKVMQQLLVALGTPAQQATPLAQAIQEWRLPADSDDPPGRATLYRTAGLPYLPTGKPFRSVDELGLVRGMTPEILATLSPYVSVYQEGTTEIALAAPLVARVLAAAGGDWGSPPEGAELTVPLIAQITAETIAHGHVAFTRRAVVRFAAVTQSNPSPWRILAWDAAGEE